MNSQAHWPLYSAGIAVWSSGGVIVSHYSRIKYVGHNRNPEQTHREGRPSGLGLIPSPAETSAVKMRLTTLLDAAWSEFVFLNPASHFTSCHVCWVQEDRCQ